MLLIHACTVELLDKNPLTLACECQHRYIPIHLNLFLPLFSFLIGTLEDACVPLNLISLAEWQQYCLCFSGHSRPSFISSVKEWVILPAGFV